MTEHSYISKVTKRSARPRNKRLRDSYASQAVAQPFNINDPSSAINELRSLLDSMFTAHYDEEGGLKSIEARADLWSVLGLTAKGSGPGGTGGGIDLNRVWEALAANTNEKIHISHIPSIPNSRLENNKVTIAGNIVSLGGTLPAATLGGAFGETDVPYAKYASRGDRLIKSATSDDHVNLSTNLNTGGFARNYTGASCWENGPSGASYGGALMLGCAISEAASLQGMLLWDVNHDVDTPTRRLWFQARNNKGWKADWKRIWLEGDAITGTEFNLSDKGGFRISGNNVGFTDGSKYYLTIDIANNAVRKGASNADATLGTSANPWAKVYADELYVGDKGSWKVSGNTVGFSDGSKFYLVLDLQNNAVRRASGNAETTLGTEANPWAKVYGKATDADHADVATNADKLDGSHKADLVADSSNIYTPATRGWYTLATLPADASASRCRYVFALDCTGLGSTATAKYFACDITLYEDGGSKVIRLEGSNGNGMASRFRYVKSTRQLQMYIGIATLGAFTLQAHNTLSGVGVRTKPTLSSSTASARSTADTTSYASTDLVTLDWTGGYAITGNAVVTGNVTAKK